MTKPDLDTKLGHDRWHLRLLDNFSLRGPDGDVGLTARKSVALLVFLALQRDRTVRRDTVANMLWSGVDTAQGRVSLRQAVAAIRRVEDATPFLITHGDTITLSSTIIVDVDEFVRLAGGDLADRTAAADLYRTDLVAGFQLRDEPAFNEWLAIAQAHWRQRAIDVLLSLAEVSITSVGDVGAGITAALKLLSIDPFNEAAHRILMRLYARQGRAALALAQYRGLADLLRRELQVTPDAETQALFEQLKGNRRQSLLEPTPIPPQAFTAPSGSPSATETSTDAISLAEAPDPAKARRRRWPWLAGGSMALMLITGGYAVWRVGARLFDRPPAITRVYPLAAGEEDERQPALSPDGTLVAYRLRHDGVADIYMSATDGTGEPAKVTSDVMTEASPVWRPDGRAIAFVREGPNGEGRCAIFVRPVPIGQEQQVGRCMTSFTTKLSWSADGETIYFDDDASASTSRRIFGLRIADGTVRAVTAGSSGGHGDYQPVVSHDGMRIAFLRLRDSASDLVVQDLATHAVSIVRRDVVGLWGVAWSAADRGLFYTVLDGSQAGLWWVPVRPDATPTRLSSGLTSYNTMSASSSGKRLAIQVAQRRSAFLKLARGSASPVEITLPGFATNDFDKAIVQSRDGSFAFVTTRSGSEQLMMARPGQAPRALPVDAGAFSWLAWSPNGRFLAVAATTDGQSTILVHDVSTRRTRRFASRNAFDNYPAWSADGRYLYWSALRPGGSALVRTSTAGSPRIEPIANGQFGISRFSSDGRFIYYTQVGKAGLWRRSLTAGGRPDGPSVPIVGDLPSSAFRSWALTGDGLFYKRTNIRGIAELCRKDLATGQVTTVLTAADDQTTFQPYAAADGGILIERVRYQNDLTGIDVE